MSSAGMGGGSQGNVVRLHGVSTRDVRTLRSPAAILLVAAVGCLAPGWGWFEMNAVRLHGVSTRDDLTLRSAPAAILMVAAVGCLAPGWVVVRKGTLFGCTVCRRAMS